MPVTPDTPDTRDLGWAAEQTHRTDAAYSRDPISACNGLRAFESDFDRAQGQLRAIASAWLLAGIGAIGFLTIQEFSYAEVNGATRGLAPDTAAILRHSGTDSDGAVARETGPTGSTGPTDRGTLAGKTGPTSVI